jgi:hypothetical protein
VNAAVKQDDAAILVLRSDIADRLRQLTDTRTPTVGAVVEKFLDDVFGSSASAEETRLRLVRAVEAARKQEASMEELKRLALQLIAQAPLPFAAQATLVQRITENDFSWLVGDNGPRMQRPTTLRRRGRPAKRIVDKSGELPIDVDPDDAQYHLKDLEIVSPPGPPAHLIERCVRVNEEQEMIRESLMGASWSSGFACPIPKLLEEDLTHEERELVKWEWIFPERFRNFDCLATLKDNHEVYRLPWPVDWSGPFWGQQDLRKEQFGQLQENPQEVFGKQCIDFAWLRQQRLPHQMFTYATMESYLEVEEAKSTLFWPLDGTRFPHDIRGFRGYYRKRDVKD